MKNLISCPQVFLVVVSMLIVSASFSQSFHSMSLERSDGNAATLNTLQGKMVLIIVTAVDVTPDNTGLEDLQKKFLDLVVLELPVQRLASSTNSVQRKDSGATIIARETKDTTDVNGRLLSWLTKAEGNTHFTIKELQIGQKYFIDGMGELYGVLPSEFSFLDPRIEAILNRTALPTAEKR